MAVKAAEKGASTCEPEHQYGSDFQSRSFENLFKGGSSDPTAIAMKWYMERLFYDRLTDTCSAKETSGGYSTCGHYTGMVDARVTQLGCAIRACKSNPSSHVAYCEYRRSPE